MKITHIPQTLWYEDENGNKLNWSPDFTKGYNHPKKARYQVSQFPNVLRTTYLRLNDDGTSTEIFCGNASYPQDLVLAMANSKDFTLNEAILITANCCEKCMNSLAHMYGLSWGYPEYGEEWKKTGTSCEYCEAEVPLWKKLINRTLAFINNFRSIHFPPKIKKAQLPISLNRYETLEGLLEGINNAAK